jgi:hypothetical protein
MTYIFTIQFSVWAKFFLGKVPNRKDMQLDFNGDKHPAYYYSHSDDFLFNCGKIVHTEEDGWHYHLAYSSENLVCPDYVTQKRKEYGLKIVVIAKNKKEALLFFLQFLTYGHIPRHLDPPYCIDKNIGGNLTQERITKDFPLPLNMSNWPVTIENIEIHKLCPHCTIYDNALLCKKGLCIESMGDYEDDEYKLCAIGSTNSFNLRYGNGDLDACVPWMLEGKEIQKQPFLITDYTKKPIKVTKKKAPAIILQEKKEETPEHVSPLPYCKYV